MTSQSAAPWQVLDWDTNAFGFLTVKLDTPDSPQELATSLGRARESKVRLAYLTLRDHDARLAEQALQAGGTLVDLKSTFVASSRDIVDRIAPLSRRIELASNTHEAALFDLALEAGEYSRFRLDPRFPRHLFEKLYAAWMSNSLNGSIAQAVFVDVADSGEVHGMATAGVQSSHADIGLVAVAARHRGRGIGAQLIRAVADWACDRGLTQVHVVTQAANEAACTLYSRCGFTLASSVPVFHFWFDDDGMTT